MHHSGTLGVEIDYLEWMLWGWTLCRFLDEFKQIWAVSVDSSIWRYLSSSGNLLDLFTYATIATVAIMRIVGDTVGYDGASCYDTLVAGRQCLPSQTTVDRATQVYKHSIA